VGDRVRRQGSDQGAHVRSRRGLAGGRGLHGGRAQAVRAGALHESNWVLGSPRGTAIRLGLKRTTLQSRTQNIARSTA